METVFDKFGIVWACSGEKFGTRETTHKYEGYSESNLRFEI